MTRLSFDKMHGLGNDFVLIDENDLAGPLTPEQIRAIADRRRGVGFDQLIVWNARQDRRAEVLFYNADGSLSAACGNGSRALMRLLCERLGWREADLVTGAGTLRGRVANDLYEIDMLAPGLAWRDVPLAKAADTLHLSELEDQTLGVPTAVSMGNPHLVFFSDPLDDRVFREFGPLYERHPMLPERANVSFVEVRSPRHLQARVWERGVGPTLACGSAACAVLVGAVRRGMAEREAEVGLPGGSLSITWRESDDHVLMTGPATHNFRGQLDPTDLAAS
ncbi:MAG: diaminopimelate epimerase [Geminicoccaceae bacterium]